MFTPTLERGKNSLPPSDLEKIPFVNICFDQSFKGSESSPLTVDELFALANSRVLENPQGVATVDNSRREYRESL